jgi:8-oxo-dGTP diphosphatase
MRYKKRRYCDAYRRLINISGQEVTLSNNGIETRLRFGADIEAGLGSSIVVPVYAGKLVMVYHNTRLGWEFPGGRRIDGENHAACASRELFEETGLSAKEVTAICTFEVLRNKEKMTGVIFATLLEHR